MHKKVFQPVFSIARRTEGIDVKVYGTDRAQSGPTIKTAVIIVFRPESPMFFSEEHKKSD